MGGERAAKVLGTSDKFWGKVKAGDPERGRSARTIVRERYGKSRQYYLVDPDRKGEDGSGSGERGKAEEMYNSWPNVASGFVKGEDQRKCTALSSRRQDCGK